MMASTCDRNLLFGILALQLDFITREQLISGMQAWVLAKERPLADLLQQAGSLSPEHRAALEAIVAAHVKQHNNDPQQSLAAISSVAEIHDELSQIADPQLDASLPHIAAAAAKYRSLGDVPTQSVGESTSAGTRFRILRPHAQGGLGKVSVARDGELNREVALKEIRPQYADDPSSRSRFMLEAEVTGGLEHPGIVPVYGLGTYSNGRPFYAMRFIRGDNLKEAIALYHDPERVKTQSAGDRAVELRQLLGRLIDVCQAIQYAHDRGVLHRDLKPGNIMLGKYGETLVVDWGLAKAQGKAEPAKSLQQEPTLAVNSGSSSEPTQMGSVVGTLQYMSPEQAAGRMDLLGPATDVFALGATLYHILVGKAPYQQTSREELIAAVQKAQFPTPRQLNSSVPKALEAICLKAMAKEPTARYASAAELVDDLEHWLADEAVIAQHDTWLDRLTRFGRRHRAVVLASGIALGVLALVSFIAAVLIDDKRVVAELASKEATRQKELAEQNLNRLEWSTYASHIEQASRAWDERNVALAEYHLAECRKELRGWEYDYLKRVFYRNRLMLERPEENSPDSFFGPDVRDVIFTSDDKQVVSLDSVGRLTKWDSATGKILHRQSVLTQEMPQYSCCTFDLLGDQFVVAGHTGKIVFWDLKSLKIRREFESKLVLVSSLTISPDGKQLLIGDQYGKITFFDVKEGEKLRTIEGGNQSVRKIVYSPDGTELICANDDGSVKICESATGEELRTLTGHSLGVQCVAVSPDGNKIVTGDLNGELRVWNVKSGEVLHTMKAHPRFAESVSFSPDGKIIVSGGGDNMLKWWDVETGKEKGALQGHTKMIRCVAFDHKGDRIVSGGYDYNVIVWPVTAPVEPVLVNYRADIQAVALSPVGNRFACTFGNVVIRASGDLGIGVWDLSKVENVWANRGHNDLMRNVLFSVDGSQIFTSGIDGFVRSWEAETGKLLTTFSGHSMSVFGMALSRDSKLLVSGSGDKSIKLWDANSGKEIKNFVGHFGIVNCVGFSNDGKRIASGSDDNTVRVWDVATGKQLFKCSDHTGALKGVFFSPDGTRIISGGNDKTVKIWDSNSGKLLNTLNGHTDSILSLDLSPDGKRIISASMDNTLKIWDAESGQETFTFRGFPRPVICCAFSPDGKRIIVGGADYAVRVFDSSPPQNQP